MHHQDAGREGDRRAPRSRILDVREPGKVECDCGGNYVQADIEITTPRPRAAKRFCVVRMVLYTRCRNGQRETK